MQDIEIQDLIEKAQWAPEYSIEKSDILLQALKLGNASGYESINSIKSDLIDCFVFQGRTHLALPYFSDLLSSVYKKNDVFIFDKLNVLWKYKWIVNQIGDYTNISKQQILDILEDFKVKFMEHSSSCESTVIDYSIKVLQCIGNMEEADILRKRLDLLSPEKNHRSVFSLDDCEACNLNSKVIEFIFHGAFDKALELAAPLISRELTCREVPGSTWPYLSLAKLNLGDFNSAETCFKLGLEYLSEDKFEIIPYALLIIFCVRTNRLNEGLEIFSKRIEYAYSSYNQTNNLFFFKSSALLFNKMSENLTDIQINLPTRADIYNPQNRYLLKELVKYFSNLASDIVLKFEERNGNKLYTDSKLNSFNLLCGLK